MAKIKHIADWFNRKYFEWEQSTGERQTVTSFAVWLNIPRVDASRYLSGERKPNGDNLQKVADKLGDEIYDLLGWARPITDERLRTITNTWASLSEKTKRAMHEIATGKGRKRKAG